ncbi:MAG: Cobalt-zinc-cadmium resistance protein CzcC [Verrucomicrobia subdivision 3 bacterium]|nr:Cobalt-zinc-cadmium resistance protein CzcC [Limisphaerales bacterium]MCS1412629.1 Cobalt-zinc-cadmium resistance protein CzcC [Limisphaerales bacterium]
MALCGNKTNTIESPPSTVLSLNLAGLPDVVRQGNLRLKGARFRIEEARARLKVAGRWQNPTVQTDYQDDPNRAEFSAGIGLNQAFPITSRLRLEKEVSASLLAAATMEVANEERLLIAVAKTVAVKVLALAEQKRLRERQLEIARELTSFAEQASAKGEGSPLDTGHARLEETQLKLEIHHQDHEAQRIQGDLKQLLGLDPSVVIKMTGGLPAPTVIAEGTLELERRPDYQAAKRLAEAASHEIQLERARRWRDATLGLFGRHVREEDVPQGFQTEPRVGIQLSMPLPLWNKNEGAIEGKTAQAARLEQSIRALENEIRNDTASAGEMMTILAMHVGEIQSELLPAVSEHVRQIDTAYRSGLVDLQTLLRGRNQQIEIEIRLLDAVRDYYLARVRYETAIGKFD